MTRIGVALLIAGLLACDGTSQRNTAGSSLDSTRMTSPTIEDVLRVNTPRLMAIEGVTGTGIGALDGEPCILVFVREKNADLVKRIPARLEGYPVKIEPVGEVRPIN